MKSYMLLYVFVVVGLLGVAFLVFMNKKEITETMIIQRPINEESYEHSEKFEYTPTKKKKLLKFKKWVVVTSIFAPTDAIKELSKMDGWKVVVVADKITPSDWSWPNVTFLSVEEQDRLGYRIMKHIEWNTFQRKAIGYMYAIQNGAEVIYETDDDNVPMRELSTFIQKTPYRLVLNSSESVFNPHVHFGQSSTWPRGYPLDKIGYPESHSYKLCPTLEPDVVQCLVNGDPDIDAIFRLTRRYPIERIDVKFDDNAPMFLYPYKTYTPYNCQNTFFRREAFWSMILPISVPGRATDIFRAYWAEELMALVGQKLAFAPASFYQLRSQHNLLKDFKEELQVYLDIPKFTQIMSNWICSTNTFANCILEMTQKLVDAEIYEQSDYNLIQAWLEDLRSIDPSLIEFPLLEKKDHCLPGSKHDVVFYPHEELITMPHDPHLSQPAYVSNHEVVVEHYKSLCGENYGNYLNLLGKNKKSFEDYLLVIPLSSEVERKIIFFISYYKVHFDHILFCSETKPDMSFLHKWKSSIIFFDENTLNQEACLSAASKMGYNVTGIFLMPENMMLNTESDIRLENNNKKVWLPNILDYFSSEAACRTKSCFTFTKEEILDLERVLKLNKVEDIWPLRKLIFSELRAFLKHVKNKKVHLRHFFPAYIPIEYAYIFYFLEVSFTPKIIQNEKLYFILLYMALHSDNNMLISHSEKKSSSVVFYSNSTCHSSNINCLCHL